MYLKLLKTLYGLSKSGDSWFHKWKDTLKKERDLSTMDGDLSFHSKDNEITKNLHGTIPVYVDDTPASGNVEF